jgi:hypothetical protein
MDISPGALHLRVAAGRAPLGRTTNVEIVDPEPIFNHPFVDGVRERNHLYATAGFERTMGLSFGLLGGYQVLPEDRTVSNDRSPNLTTIWPKSSGYQAGGQLSFVRGQAEHHLIASYGSGDVEMGWGAPDWVYAKTATRNATGSPVRAARCFRRSDWGAMAGSSFRFMGGVWAQWRRPRPEQRVWTVFNEQSKEPESRSETPHEQMPEP